MACASHTQDPRDLFVDKVGRQRPRLRLLRGFDQRVEQDPSEGAEEGDFELSFACPGGMSGSPLLTSIDSHVVGMVIGNQTSYSGLSEVPETTFGRALDIRRAEPWLSETFEQLKAQT
jgi:hypothetical protein